MIQIYIIIGFIYSFIVTLGTESLIRSGMDESRRLNFIETIILILLWPIYVIALIHRTLSNNDDK